MDSSVEKDTLSIESIVRVKGAINKELDEYTTELDMLWLIHLTTEQNTKTIEEMYKLSKRHNSHLKLLISN